jgi:hypothetical protein
MQKNTIKVKSFRNYYATILESFYCKSKMKFVELISYINYKLNLNLTLIDNFLFHSFYNEMIGFILN